jgi:hypothetical protein
MYVSVWVNCSSLSLVPLLLDVVFLGFTREEEEESFSL